MRDKPRPERRAEAVTPTMVRRLKFFVNKGRRVILQAVTDQFSIGKASAHKKV